MALKDLIASPGHVAAAQITKRFRYSGDAHADLFEAITEAVNAAVTSEREACATLVHDRLGADGYGVAQMIRARGEKR